MDILFVILENPKSYIRNFLTACVIGVTVIWYAHYLWKRRYLYMLSWNVEGPLAFLIIGSGYLFVGKENRKYIIPAKCSVVIAPFCTHRDPAYWKDPLKFDPDRFLLEEVAKSHPCKFISFSHGPRECISGVSYQWHISVQS